MDRHTFLSSLQDELSAILQMKATEELTVSQISNLMAVLSSNSTVWVRNAAGPSAGTLTLYSANQLEDSPPVTTERNVWSAKEIAISDQSTHQWSILCTCQF